MSDWTILFRLPDGKICREPRLYSNREGGSEMKHLLIITMATCVCAQAEAQTSKASLNAEKLFDWCTSDQKTSLEFFECVLYIKGFLAGYSAASAKAAGHLPAGMSLCLPDRLGAGEAAAAYVQQWRAAGRQKGTNNLGVVKEADPDVALTVFLSLSYPCKPN